MKMSPRMKTAVVVVLLNCSIAVAGSLTGDALTGEEKALLDWADRYQARVQDVCRRICAPSRVEAEEQMQAVLDELAAQQERHGDLGMNGLARIASYSTPNAVWVDTWGPALERELTLRQANLLRAWYLCQKDHSPRRFAVDALRRGHTVNDAIEAWRKAVLRDEFIIAHRERACREIALRKTVRQYAINCLLGGHPDTYLPAQWTELARRSRRGRLSAATGELGGPADDPLKSVRAEVKHLTQVLLSVGMGDFSPDYLVEVERQLRHTRRRAQTVMLALTGRRPAGAKATLAADKRHSERVRQQEPEFDGAREAPTGQRVLWAQKETASD